MINAHIGSMDLGIKCIDRRVFDTKKVAGVK